jgi:hypothetical protein
MDTRQPARQGDARSTTKPIDFNAAAIDHAVRLIHQVCCFAGSFDLLDEFRDQALCAAVDRHDSAAPWILEPSATELYVNRICTSLPSSLRIA